MKKLLWKLAQKYFKLEISADRLEFCNVTERHGKKIGLKINYPIGQRVILRSNEPGDLFIGQVVDYMRHENSDSYFLVVSNGSESLITFDQKPAFWTQEREDALRKLKWYEQYNVMSKFDYVISEKEALKKEAELEKV